jgi:hypothetical protein
MTTIATFGLVDPAAGSIGEKASRRELRCRAWLFPSHLCLGRPAPQRFGDHSLVDFATPRYRTLPMDRAQQVLGQAARALLLDHSADVTSRSGRGIVGARPTLSRRVCVRCAVSVLQCRKRGELIDDSGDRMYLVHAHAQGNDLLEREYHGRIP